MTTIVERAGGATTTTAATENTETETIVEVAARTPTATATATEIVQGLATDESGAVPAPPTRAGGATAAGTMTEIATEDEIDHDATTTTTTNTMATRLADADATVTAPKATTMMIMQPHKNHAAAAP